MSKNLISVYDPFYGITNQSKWLNFKLFDIRLFMHIVQNFVEHTSTHNSLQCVIIIFTEKIAVVDVGTVMKMRSVITYKEPARMDALRVFWGYKCTYCNNMISFFFHGFISGLIRISSFDSLKVIICFITLSY